MSPKSENNEETISHHVSIMLGNSNCSSNSLIVVSTGSQMNREYIHIYAYIYIHNICIYLCNYMYIWMSLDVPSSLSSIVPSTAKSIEAQPPPQAATASTAAVAGFLLFAFWGAWDVLTRREAKLAPKGAHQEWPWAWWIPFPHIQQPPRNPGFRKGFTHIWDHIWVFKYLEYSGDHPRMQPVRLLLRICIAFRLHEGKKSGDVLSRGFEPLRKRDVDHSSQKNTVQRHHLSMKRQQNRPSCPMR